MSLYQLRGVTGFNPRRNDMADLYEKSALLPYQRQADFSRAASEEANTIANKRADQEQAYYTQMAGLSKDANDAAAKDRMRGLVLQGGMAALSGYNALNDAVGGDLVGKSVNAVQDVFTPAINGRGVGSAARDAFSAYGGSGGGWGDALMGFGKDYIADPLAKAGGLGWEGLKKAGDWASEGISDFLGMFS